MSGALTAEQAKRYFICRVEKESRFKGGFNPGTLYLVENVQLEIATGRPADPRTEAVQDIDYQSPVYPIRGSYVQYSCLAPREARLSGFNERLRTRLGGNDESSCTQYLHAQAHGKCIRTTFGDWRCGMADGHATKKFRQPPPAANSWNFWKPRQRATTNCGKQPAANVKAPNS